MDQNGTSPELEPEHEEKDIALAAVERHMQRRGMELERLQLGLLNLKSQGRFVYKVELRAPSTKSGEWLCLMKMVDPDGAHIAFQSGGSMLATLLSAGRRIQGGALEWREDEYPPDDADERLAFLHKNSLWLLY